MKTKKLILVPVIAMTLSGCAIDSFEWHSTAPISASESYQSSYSSDDSTSSLDASSKSSEASSSEAPASSFSAGEPTFEGVNELRNPSGLSHSLPDGYRSSEGYITFKSKMKAFSNRLSDIFVERFFDENSNFVISPLSIEMCLGLAMRSAQGETRNEILEAFDMDYETFNTNFKLYYNYLSHVYKNNSDEIISQLLLSNSIWIDDDIELKGSGLDALRDDYYCYSYGVDIGDNAKANNAMREFINYHSKGMLNPNLDIPADALFVLMNVLYAKSLWREDGDDLRLAPTEYKFTNSDGTESSKRLLNSKYISGKPIITDDFSGFLVPLQGLRVYFVKPNEDKELKDVFNKDNMEFVLNPDNIITQDDEKMEKYTTECIFPEFSTEGDFDLKPLLREDLGIDSLFSPISCDMSSLTDEQVYCDGIRHLTKLDVNKKGLEGAAVTYMWSAGAGMPQPDPYTYIHYKFVVDKEFGFIVTRGDNVVFSGVVNNID